MPKAARTRAQQRRLEWALLALALLCLVAWLSPPQQMAGLNHLVQDLGLRSLARPPHPDIVVIAVDDRSITSIGRWPWRRALHAQLIDVVTAQNPKAIGLDILFSEPDLDYPLDDALLAQALARSQRVVLPVLQRNQAGLMECRIPDDCIDSNRYPLFMARAVLKELIESLQSTQAVKPC